MNTVKRIIGQTTILAWLILLSVGELGAQVAPEVKVPLSPNAAALEKFANVPVSLYTGVPNINVPICALKSRSLSVPISLSYHNTGFKPNEMPSWVGLGWTLNAGGAITRTVHGKADEELNGYWQYTQNNTIKQSYNLYGAGGEGAWWFITDLAQKSPNDPAAIDTQPDVFSFNVGGYTGKFFIKWEGGVLKPFFIPHQEVKITIPTDLASGQWEITVPDGTRYIFGGGFTEKVQNRTIQRTQGSLNGYTYPVRTYIAARYLKKIISANGDDFVDFHYQKANPTTYFKKQYSEQLRQVTYSDIVRAEVSGYSSFKTACNSETNPTITETETTVLDRQHISHIVTATGDQVYFREGATRDDYPDQSLAEVAKVASSGELVKVVKLKYKYLTLGAYKRLLLDSAQEFNNSTPQYATTLHPDNQVSKGAYTFDYYTPVGVSVDATFEKGIDHWGYYNGANNETLIPYYGAYREINPERAKIGVITEMHYPTGGKTTFSWEANTYSNDGGYNTIDEQVNEVVEVSNYATLLEGNGEYVIKEKSICLDSAQFLKVETTINHQSTSNLIEPYLKAKVITPVDQSLAEWKPVLNVKGNTQQVIYLRAGTYKLQIIGHGQVSNGNAKLKFHYSKKIHQKSSNRPGPGLRIAQTTSLDGLNTGNNLTKAYRYQQFNNPTYSSGNLLSPVSYYRLQEHRSPMQFFGGQSGGITRVSSESSVTHWVKKELQTGPGYEIVRNSYKDKTLVSTSAQNVSTEGGGSGISGCVGDAKCTFLVMHSDNVYPIDYTKGSEIGYTQVTELISKGGFHGRNESEFSYTPLLIPTFGPRVSQDYLRGHLLKSRSYDKQGRIRESVENTYSTSARGEANYAEAIGLAARYVYRSACFPNERDIKKNEVEFRNFYLISAWHRLDQTKTTVYTYEDADVAGNHPQIQTNITSNFYGSTHHSFATKVNTDNSENEVIQVRNLYPQDITAGTHGNKIANTAQLLLGQHRIGTPVVSITTRSGKVVGAKYVAYGQFGDLSEKVLPTVSYVTELAAPIQETALFQTDAQGNYVHFIPKVTFDFEVGTSVLKTTRPTDHHPITYLWNANRTLLLAETVNATSEQVNYTSFESAQSLGGWVPGNNYTLATVAGRSLTGAKALYQAPGSGGVNIESQLTINAPATYQVSFWQKGNGTITISGVTGSLNPIKTVGDWKLYQTKVALNPGGKVTLTVPEGVYLDELRLHPAQAQMKTYTYRPLVGVTSMNGVNNQTAYYEYDGLKRLRLVRDFEGNILKRYTYQYKNK